MFNWLKGLFKGKTEKDIATKEGKPYVKVLQIDFDEKDPSKGFFELDWNTQFVDNLRNAGYTGVADEQVIDQWFTELCTSIVRDAVMGDVINPSGSATPRKFKHDDGFTEYQ